MTMITKTSWRRDHERRRAGALITEFLEKR
jgi:hypothetical protein